MSSGVRARGSLIDTRFCRVDSLKATRASNPQGPNTLNRDKTAISMLEKLLIVFATKTDPMWAVYLLMLHTAIRSIILFFHVYIDHRSIVGTHVFCFIFN